MIMVYNAKDDIEANWLMSILEEEGIQCYSRDSGSGEYMKITCGFSVFGKDIYVEEDCAERAKAIVLKNLQKEEETSDLEDEIKIPWYKKRVILVRIWLAFFVGGIALMYILAEIL